MADSFAFVAGDEATARAAAANALGSRPRTIEQSFAANSFDAQNNDAAVINFGGDIARRNGGGQFFVLIVVCN